MKSLFGNNSNKNSYLQIQNTSEKGVDRAGIVETIQRLSQLVTDLPMIQELDLNPVIAYEDRVAVVDVRISV